MSDPSDREAAGVELLDAWPWQHGGALIGGYAVAAYGAPRYSDDLDIVVPTDALEPLVTWLTAERDFKELQVPPDLMQNYAGKVGRWANDELTVDLLPGVVRDREAQIDIPERWITRDPIRERLVLIETSTRNAVPVVRKEAFWALKLQAGRVRDLGDLLSIGARGTDLGQVRELFQNMMCDTLAAKLAKVQAALEHDKTYRDTLSQRLLGSPSLPKNRDAWEHLKANVAACIPTDAEN